MIQNNSKYCPSCQAPNPPAACFCQDCGNRLGATIMRDQTIPISNPGPRPQFSNNQVRTIVKRAQQTFGNAPMSFGYSQTSKANQREHTVFVIDVSGSMGWDYDGRLRKLDAAIRANVTMVLNKAQIDPHDEIGIVIFDDSAQALLPLRPLHSHKRQIIQTLQSLTIGGGTDINEGLKAAHDVFDWSRSDVVRRIVLLTDGQGGHPLRTAEDLKSRGIVIDVVGVGQDPSGVDEKLLRKVASVIEGEVRYRFIKDQQTLVIHYTQLANKTATTSFSGVGT